MCIRDRIKAAFQEAIDNGPELAYVNSDKGITNLHVPSDVIVDASMPAMIRTSGQMWGRAGEQKDTLAVLPDSSYAGVYPVSYTHLDVYKRQELLPAPGGGHAALGHCGRAHHGARGLRADVHAEPPAAQARKGARADQALSLIHI